MSNIQKAAKTLTSQLLAGIEAHAAKIDASPVDSVMAMNEVEATLIKLSSNMAEKDFQQSNGADIARSYLIEDFRKVQTAECPHFSQLMLKKA
jgi:hypothetical protein